MDNIEVDQTVPEQCPLSGVVIATETYNVGKINVFRRYGGSMSTSTRVAGRADSGLKSIYYRVGRRDERQIIPGVPTDSRIGRTPQYFKMNETLFQELDSKMRKYLNNAPDFSTADLSGVVYRLSASLALYSMSGVLSMADIRGPGVSLRARAISVVDRAMPSTGFVYVPTSTSLVDCPAAFAAMVCAINGAGAMAVSEMVVVNSETNAPRLRAAADADLAYGCLTALRILLSIYESSNAGSIAGLAVARGIHAVVSVVGHTDEGGYVRDVIRAGSYAVPCGGVFSSRLNDFVHFPVFGKGDRLGVNTLVDGIALKTAAAVAVCDPLVYMGGRAYPTTFSVGAGDRSGVDGGELSSSQNRHLRGSIAQASGEFCTKYVEELGRLVTGDSGCADTATQFLIESFSIVAASGTPNRHISGRVVAPFYWIEPTSLYKVKMDTPANNEGFGVLVGTKERFETEAYPKCQVIANMGTRIGVSIEMRSMRTVPAIMHSYMHLQDGLAHMVPYRMAPDRVAMMGGGHDPESPAGDSAEDNFEAHRGLDAYAWRHGSADIPSPAECMYIGGKVGVILTLAEVEFGTFGTEANHVVAPYDTLGVVRVRYAAGPPSSMGVGVGMDLPSNVRRSRGKAEQVLSSLNNKLAGTWAARVTDLTFQKCEPGGFDVSEIETAYGEAAEIQGAEVNISTLKDPVQGTPLSRIHVDQTLRISNPRRAAGMQTSSAGEVYEEDPVGTGEPAAPAVEAGGDDGVEYEEGLPPGQDGFPAPEFLGRDDGNGNSNAAALTGSAAVE